jgi:hypothetical protein
LLKKLSCVLALAAASLVLAGGASALTVGVNDDTPKNASQSAWFYSTMRSTR